MQDDLVSDHDDLFDDSSRIGRKFTFDQDVVRVFPDMINRSVPGYGELVGMIGLWASEKLPVGGRCYDLGCSLGAVTLAILQQVTPDIKVIAVDNSTAMISRLERQLTAAGQLRRVELRCEDIFDTKLDHADMVVLNLTLQFLPREQRSAMLQRIHASLNPHGILILAEKVSSAEPADQLCLDHLHYRFKKANGYSEMAIARKREALEEVLVPDTPEEHERRLSESGFSRHLCWFQMLNFVAWTAWK